LRGVLFIVSGLSPADASLLPTGGNGDAPSLTIQALAVRTADKLLARLGWRQCRRRTPLAKPHAVDA